jgi:hypothetical protein
MSVTVVGKAGRVKIPACEIDVYRRRGYVPLDEYAPPVEESKPDKAKKSGKKKDQETAETVADSEE